MTVGVKLLHTECHIRKKKRPRENHGGVGQFATTVLFAHFLNNRSGRSFIITVLGA
jgi:hypothetical protein